MQASASHRAVSRTEEHIGTGTLYCVAWRALAPQLLHTPASRGKRLGASSQLAVWQLVTSPDCCHAGHTSACSCIAPCRLLLRLPLVCLSSHMGVLVGGLFGEDKAVKMHLFFGGKGPEILGSFSEGSSFWLTEGALKLRQFVSHYTLCYDI